MSHTKDNIIRQEVRRFFKKFTWKKTLTFLFFLLLSSIFWVMQVYRQKFEYNIVIPIEYVNVPDSLFFENEFPTTVSVLVKDDGAALFRYYFTKSKDSIRIDVKQVLKTKGNNVVNQLVQKKLFQTTEILGIYPAQISFAHSLLHSKKVPVIYDGHIDLPPGYIIDGDITINPDSVSVFGGKNALDTIDFAHTVSDTLYGIKSDARIMVKLKPLAGTKYTPDKVQLNIPVDEFTRKEVDVPVECVNLPYNLKIIFFPSTVKIPIFVGLKRYNQIKTKDFRVVVDYNEIKGSKNVAIPIRITESPDYIRTKIPVPSEVEFILEQK